MNKLDLAVWIQERIDAGETPVFTIDNDAWTVYAVGPESEEMHDGSFVDKPGYPRHHLYGGGILTALAEIVGVRLEAI